MARNFSKDGSNERITVIEKDFYLPEGGLGLKSVSFKSGSTFSAHTLLEVPDGALSREVLYQTPGKHVTIAKDKYDFDISRYWYFPRQWDEEEFERVYGEVFRETEKLHTQEIKNYISMDVHPLFRLGSSHRGFIADSILSFTDNQEKNAYANFGMRVIDYAFISSPRMPNKRYPVAVCRIEFLSSKSQKYGNNDASEVWYAVYLLRPDKTRNLSKLHYAPFDKLLGVSCSENAGEFAAIPGSLLDADSRNQNIIRVILEEDKRNNQPEKSEFWGKIRPTQAGTIRRIVGLSKNVLPHAIQETIEVVTDKGEVELPEWLTN